MTYEGATLWLIPIALGAIWVAVETLVWFFGG